MWIQVKAGRYGQAAAGVRVVAALEGKSRFQKLVPAANRALEQLAASAHVKGSLNEAVFLPVGKRWVLVVGLGKAKDLTLDRVRQLAGTAAKAVRARGFASLSLPVLDDAKLGSSAAVAQALVEGAVLGVYRYDKLRTTSKDEQRKRIEAVTLVVERSGNLAMARRGAQKAQVIAEAVCLVRDYINGPSNLVTPTFLANEARAIAKQFKLKCTVIPFAQLKRLGFGGIVAVAQGSAHPAQFIVLEYAPARAKATIALCGKGITFDTGGINLKSTANKIELMKYDMSGAAAVLGTLKAAAALKLPVRLVGIIAATENMPSGTAQKPGDVLTTLSGKTVEVLNTDAEGRLVLSDCLHYAKRFKPDATIDIATLTGACTVTLGSQATGLMANDEAIAKRITEAAELTRERVWRLPLWEEFGGSYITRDIADLKNISGTNEAGTITAGKFLEQFVDGMKWAHLDIAGTAWSGKDKPYVPKGAVGIGVRLLVEMLSRWK